MSLSCLFCRISKGEIPTELLEDTTDFVAFKDINPQAPVHVLVIPREHIATLADASESHSALLGRLLAVVPKLAKRLELAEGYRTVINSGAQAGQTVFHLHIHLLGGRKFKWPPG